MDGTCGGSQTTWRASNQLGSHVEAQNFDAILDEIETLRECDGRRRSAS